MQRRKWPFHTHRSKERLYVRSSINASVKSQASMPQQLTDAMLTSTQPVVMRGLAASLADGRRARSTSAQSADAYLRRFYRDATVNAMHGGAGDWWRFFYNEDVSGFNFSSDAGALRRGARRAARASARRKAARAVRRLDDHRHLPAGLPRGERSRFRRARSADASIWVGNRTRIPAHYDLPDNIACVAAGRRRFTLFPPRSWIICMSVRSTLRRRGRADQHGRFRASRFRRRSAIRHRARTRAGG
jgi:hypothetical protein